MLHWAAPQQRKPEAAAETAVEAVAVAVADRTLLQFDAFFAAAAVEVVVIFGNSKTGSRGIDMSQSSVSKWLHSTGFASTCSAPPPRTESEINVNAKVCHAARMLIKANQAMIKLYNSQFYKWNSKQKVKKANSKLFSASSARFCLFFATHDSIEVREFVGNEIQSGNWEVLRGRARREREGKSEREGVSVA